MSPRATPAKISLTGEFILRIIDGRVEREYSPEVGLNLFRFCVLEVSQSDGIVALCGRCMSPPP